MRVRSFQSDRVAKMARPDRGALGKARKQKARKWQSDAYDLLESIPELGFALMMKAATCGQGELKVRRRTEDGTWRDVTGVPAPPVDDPEGEPVPPDPADVAAIRVRDGLKGPQGGYQALVEAFTLHREVAGECRLVGRDEVGWEIYSVEECVQDRGQWMLVDPGDIDSASLGVSAKKELLGDAWVEVWRRRAPRNTKDAWSALRPLVQTGLECIDVSNSIRAIGRSRTIADLIVISEGMTFGSQDELADGEDDFDALVDEFAEHYGTPIEPDGDPIPPMLLQLPYKFMRDGLKKISLAREFDRFSLELRRDQRDRFALGLDMPPEMLLGKKGLSHWMGWNLDQDFVVKHINPAGGDAAAFFTAAYFVPRLAVEPLSDVDGGTPVGETVAAEFRLEYDPTPIAVKPDLSQNAKDVHRAGVLSDGALLRSTGFADEDGVTDAEERERMLRYTAAGSPQAFGVLAPLLGFSVEECAVIEKLVDLTTPSKQDGTSGDQAQPVDGAPVGPTTDPGTADQGGPTQAAAAAAMLRDLAAVRRRRA